jgi:FAD/FMN-containing dehydrogenase
VPCIEDVIVPLPTLGTFIHELIDILERRQIVYGFHGHIGDGSFRVVPIFDFKRDDLHEAIFGLMEDVFALIKRLRGNMSADHSDGIIRTPFLESFYGPELASVFTKIKQIYDKDNLLNPKKKVGGTREDVVATMQRG